ncbi:MAG TPA: metalloregulator ArsR/SmtB family transcription factor [Candidatus Thermoplasmatota archaeon]|nr:metalloregulator ArsR/SmtB family transcription factor [Candidatus Thermoplasmatota archaeon]
MEPVSLLRLISEATRHRLLHTLRSGEKSVGQLVALLQDEQSNLSHHLALLRQAGLVSARREGRNQMYRLADPEVARLLDQVEQVATRMDQVAYTSGLGLPAETVFRGY